MNPESAPESRSPARMAWRRFFRNRRALLCAALLLFVGLCTIAVPWLSAHDYRESDWDYTLGPPTAKYWMGTDSIGRDLLTRLFLGGRVSFAVGLIATSISVLIGVAYGATSAYVGGRVDQAMMRFVDVLYGLPHMLLIIVAMVMLQSRSIDNVFLILGLFGWLTMSRIVRGQMLSLREREFIEAARALGTGAPAIILRHMIPNILGPVIVYATLSVPSAILQESFLSYLGLGISEPETSWGVLISEGAASITPDKTFWWLIAFPGGCLALTLFCLNAVGDGLRDAFDVQQRPG